MAARDRRALRPRVQMVFQDPYGSLDPRWRVGRSVMEPLQALPMNDAQRRERVAEVLAAVGLEADAALRFRISSPAASASGWRSRGRCRHGLA